MVVGGESAAEQSAALRRRAEQAKASRAAGERKAKGAPSAAKLTRDAKAWQAGAVGEQRAARALNRLNGPGVTVLHDVLLDPARAWNLDHVVVSPAGVLFVDSKNWRGDLTVFRGSLWRHWTAGPKAGRKSEDMAGEVGKVRGMAAQASERLGFPVLPVICLAGSQSRQFQGVAVVAGVTVLSVDAVHGWVRDGLAVMSSADAAALGVRVRRVFPPATVQVAEDPSSIAAQMRAGFAAARVPVQRSPVSPVLPAAPVGVPVAEAPVGRGRFRRLLGNG